MRPGPRGADDEPIKREVTINDAPGPIRYNLTRRATQDDIARRTGTTVVVRGRYVPPGAPPTEGEPPLFLKITPGLVSSEVSLLNVRCCAPLPVQEAESVIDMRARVVCAMQPRMPGSQSCTNPDKKESRMQQTASVHCRVHSLQPLAIRLSLRHLSAGRECAAAGC